MITTILFDLDGTLLPMNQDNFIKAYFNRIAAKICPLGYEPKALINAIWAGTGAMVQNDGNYTNEEVFWNCFIKILGEKVIEDKPAFDKFYRSEFQNVAASCGFNPQANQTIKKLKQLGYRLALATNPIFPAVATESRIKWAGLELEDFEMYTAYENSRYCKPNLDYYRDVVAALDCTAKECLMVGNDVDEDMVARELGMKVFLLTDCLINKNQRDISEYQQGSFSQLLEFVGSLNL